MAQAFGWRTFGCDGTFLMFDVSNRESFLSVAHHHTAMCKHAREHVRAVLVGLKSDSASGERQVSVAEAQALADSLRCPDGAPLRYIECSCRSGKGVEQAVYSLTRDCLSRRLPPALPSAPPRKPSWQCNVQ